MKNSIVDMSRDELERLIDERVERRMASLLGEFELNEVDLFGDEDEEPDNRTWEQVKRDIEQDRWIPPPGAKSSLELLRKDRDR